MARPEMVMPGSGSLMAGNLALPDPPHATAPTAGTLPVVGATSVGSGIGFACEANLT